MFMDPVLPALVGVVFFALLLGILFGRLRLPLVLAHLATGMLLGPHALDLLPGSEIVEQLGEIGLVVLLFFLGMEMSVGRLVRNWRVAVGGTLVQVLVSVAVVYGVGRVLGWPLERSVLLGFVVSLSSTAVVLPMLKEWGETRSPIGEDVLGILLVQDLAVVPMVIVVGMFQETAVSVPRLGLQLGGAALAIGLVVALARGYELPLPRLRFVDENVEMQVFAAFLVCFGMATATALLGLSTAMGAFLGGILVAEGRQTRWVRSALEPFRVLLMAFFFIGIGALLDFGFLADHLLEVGLLVAVALVLNTVVNGAILRGLGRRGWESLYGGALLSQIGEFSFVLAALGAQIGVISGFAYQTTVAVICLSLAASPLWIRAVRFSAVRFTA